MKLQKILSITAILIGATFLLGTPITSATGSSDETTECARVGTYQYAFKIDNWDSTDPLGAHPFAGNTITISNTQENDENEIIKFDWSSNPTPIGAVIVKAGNYARRLPRQALRHHLRRPLHQWQVQRRRQIRHLR